LWERIKVRGKLEYHLHPGLSLQDEPIEGEEKKRGGT
jgi:hypothetical protein